MIYLKLKENTLIDYADLATAFTDLLSPLLPFYSAGGARVLRHPPAATFRISAAHLEGFARVLWGAVPLVAGGADFAHWETVLRGIEHGTDPTDGEYWGTPGDCDQLLVEQAVFGFALLLVPDKIWKPLGPRAQSRFAAWLGSINRQTIPGNNWEFFRVLVNAGLRKVGSSVADEKQLRSSLEKIESMYLDDGWYNDGPAHDRARDYYIPWAMHFYALIYAALCGADDPDRARVFKERAALFARDFAYWFTEDGQALPFGRSLCYRFAQAAFWGALAFANVEALPWGQIKGLLLRNLRWWFKQPAFTETGLLTVGYAYPNYYIADRYNSPNSPYWACKAFLPLALRRDHPFWRAEELPLELPEHEHFQKHTGFIILNEKAAGHHYALNAGQWQASEHNHTAERYCKFAYSSAFGFNVSVDVRGLDKLAPDNMLLLAEDGLFYRFKMEDTDHKITKDYLVGTWKPFPDATVRTWIVPFGPWHLRVHHIWSKRKLQSAEGGFPLPLSDADYPLKNKTDPDYEDKICLETTGGLSAIVNLSAARKGKAIAAAPNSNVLHPRTLIPILLGEHPKGEYFLACLVMAHPDRTAGNKLLRQMPGMESVAAKIPQSIKSIVTIMFAAHDEQERRLFNGK